MTYNIFISHSWKYNDEYYKIEKWIDDSISDWRNMSVPEHDAKKADTDKELERMIDNNIKNSSGVIIISGMYTNHSKWIDKEIDIASKYGKSIIGIKPRGNERTPNKIYDNAKIIVNWNSTSLINAIKEFF
ncbi:MAG: TIR domain-containing protein [Methanobrevibacter sp.]|nr:TIR domain-containing protein [Candidatus Methanovirga australis]